MEKETFFKVKQIDKCTKSALNSDSTHVSKSERLSRKEQCDRLKVESTNSNQKLRSLSFTENIKSRKSVSFADNHGIEVDIRVFDTNQLPEVPDYVLSSLKKFRSNAPSPDIFPDFVYTHNFESVIDKDLDSIVKLKHVFLHQLVIMDDVIYGIINVFNFCPKKTVFVRCSTNKWISFIDYESKFCSTFSSSVDQFSFQICVSSVCCVFGAVIEFAICYKCAGQEFWDNNNDINYRVVKSIAHNLS